MIGAAGRRMRVGQWHAAAAAASDSGADEALPLVILAGIGMNIEMLEPLACLMPERHIIGFDMPGIGQSPDPVFPYTIPQIAITLAGMLDQLKIARVDLMGISWGGAVAQQFAFQHRARTGKLVLASTSAGGTMIPGNASLLSHLFDPREYSAPKSLRRNLAMFYNGGGNEQVSLNAATAPSMIGWTYQVTAFAAWSSAPFLPLLSVPTIVMADEDDHLIPVANGQFLHTLIPGATLALSRGGGHLFMLSDTATFTAKLRTFLDASASAEVDLPRGL
jgi:pimeloyl-ACP methyl ester carboxylesterase